MEPVNPLPQELVKRLGQMQLPPISGVVRVASDANFETADIMRITLQPGQQTIFSHSAESESPLVLNSTKDATDNPYQLCVRRDSTQPVYWFSDYESKYGSFARISKGGLYIGLKPGNVILAGSLLIEMFAEQQNESIWKVHETDAPTVTISAPKTTDITIGRDTRHTISSLSDIYLSRNHGVISYNPTTQTFTVQDGIPGLYPSSTNGVWIKMGANPFPFPANTSFKIDAMRYLLLT